MADHEVVAPSTGDEKQQFEALKQVAQENGLDATEAIQAAAVVFAAEETMESVDNAVEEGLKQAEEKVEATGIDANDVKNAAQVVEGVFEAAESDSENFDAT